MARVKTVRIRVRLQHVEPEVVRVLDVPAKVLLPELHNLLQAAVGWTDSHLHQFVTDDAYYGSADVDGFDDEQDERSVPLTALPPRFTYLYDFGDGWEHDVEVIGPGAEQPGCIDAAGACPPEDCGGPGGYTHLREVLAYPRHDEHTEMRAWAGNWRDQVDVAATDLLVRRTVGEVPAPVRLVLEMAAGGITLTPGGRLPRTFVRDVQQHYPHWALRERPASIENDLPPLAALHDVLRQAGLLRLRNKVLAPTRAADDDDLHTIRRLRSWFGPDSGFAALLADLTVATVATSDTPLPLTELAAKVFSLLGPGWGTSDGKPLAELHVRTEISRLRPVLTGLDLVDTSGPGGWTAGPSAQSLLPRATALAHLWSTTGHPY